MLPGLSEAVKPFSSPIRFDVQHLSAPASPHFPKAVFLHAAKRLILHSGKEQPKLYDVTGHRAMSEDYSRLGDSRSWASVGIAV